MIICDNCGKEIGKDAIRLRMDGIYYKMARELNLNTMPDFCSPECVIDYCSKIGKEKVTRK